MIKLCLLLSTIGISVLTWGQTPYPAGNPPISSQPTSQPPVAPPARMVASSNPGDLNAMLQRIEQEAGALNSDVGKVRVEKWKIDPTTRRQTSENIGSIQRNITGALPGLMTAVRTTPQSLAANFKLYRNLNALYDVVSSVTESTGAFGRREEYDLMAPHASTLDEDRRNYGEYLQQMTATADDRIATAEREKAAAIAVQQQAPPKKIIVDDNEPAATPAKKKKPVKKSAATNSNASASSTTTSTPK